MNQDEAMRCLDLGHKKLAANDFDGATRLLGKSKKLYPLKEAE